MKNLLYLFFVAFAMTIFVASCGSNESNSSDTTTSASTTTTETTTPAKQEEPAAKSSTASNPEGEKIFNQYCHVCHKTGVGGAMALEGDNYDKARWEKVAQKGLATLKEEAFKGYTGDFGAMPEKGTCMDCTKEQLASAIQYMFSKAGVELK